MTDPKVTVRIDNRARLMSAILAVTDWPERAQQRKGHRPHLHARNTTRKLAHLASHPAVTGAQALLSQNAPLEALYSYAFKLNLDTWAIESPPAWAPAHWNAQLQDFHQQGELNRVWNQDQALWHKAEVEAQEVMLKADFYPFLMKFVGEFPERIIYMPNISYPSDMAVGVRVADELICIGPPRIAWGDNEPWPFDDDPGHIYSSALAEFARLLMFDYLRHHSAEMEQIVQKPLPIPDEMKNKPPGWGDQFMQLFVPGVVAIYLERNVSPQEAKSFALMERKLKGITVLPGVISVLERYLKEREEGKFASFIEYLPFFPGHLRVANRVSAI
jgi:hypothetical protein